MPCSRSASRLSVTFDDDHAAADAGLALVAVLGVTQRTGGQGRSKKLAGPHLPASLTALERAVKKAHAQHEKAAQDARQAHAANRPAGADAEDAEDADSGDAGFDEDHSDVDSDDALVP
jgi:hypothetical protein